MTRKTKLTALLLAALLAIGLSGCAGRDQRYIIRIGHNDTTMNPVHINLERMARAVGERTGGRVELQILPSEQIGNNAQMFEMVMAGTLDAMILPSGEQALYACPKLQVLSLPFLFADYDEVYRVLDGEVGLELLEGMKDHNMIQLAYWENGLRQFTNSVRPIETPEDLQGLYFRTPEDAMTRSIFKALGTETGTLPLSELYGALQRGDFDGQENPIANITAYNMQNVQKYLTMVNYQYQPKGLVFSLTTWNKLPQDIQTELRNAAVEFGKQDRQDIRESEKEQLAQLEAFGMEIGYPDIGPFIERTQKVYDEFYEQNEWGRDLVERIRFFKTEQGG